QTPTGLRFHPMDDGHPEPNVPVARCAGKCQTRHADPLAPQRISPVLALEIEAVGTTAPTHAASAVDPRDGDGESLLGPGTHRPRVEAQTRNSSIASYRAEVLARRPGAHTRSQTTLADLRA